VFSHSRHIYDDLNRMWPRLKLSPCYSQAHLESSLATRWSAFNPHKMLGQFGGDPKKSFRWWCKWVFHVAARGPGKKIVSIPEVYRHCNEDSIPPELALLAQAGRELGIELVCDTSTPEKLNGSLTGACTEIVLFRLITPMSVKAMQNIFSYAGIAEDARAASCAVPLGSFKGWNRISGGSLGGRVF
jgi:hypothetical protein